MAFDLGSILNGVFGDWLHGRQNPMAINMTLRTRDHRDVATADPTEPLASTVTIFLHGLCETEYVWRFSSDRDQDYGRLLSESLGAQPLYLRYNTGLPISQNGRAFSDVLTDFVAEHPSVRRILLIGHSMGGLVIRSACHAVHADSNWLQLVTDAVYLGSPHLGAPLERVSNVVANGLASFPRDYVAFVGELINVRSQGIKDLRHGEIVADGPEDLPTLTQGIRHFAVTGTLSKNRASPINWFFGDALVPASSGRPWLKEDAAVAWTDVREFPGVAHLTLARHEGIGNQLKEWLQ